MAINIDKRLLKNKNSYGGARGYFKSLAEIQVPKWVPVAMAAVVISVTAVLIYFNEHNRSIPIMGEQQDGTAFADQIDPNALEVEVLPQTVRSFNGGGITNPFAASGKPAAIAEIKITGIIINSNGRATAIIQTNGTSYIISPGDKLPESEWVVSAIQKDGITFAQEGEEKTVYMKAKD